LTKSKFGPARKLTDGGWGASCQKNVLKREEQQDLRLRTPDAEKHYSRELEGTHAEERTILSVKSCIERRKDCRGKKRENMVFAWLHAGRPWKFVAKRERGSSPRSEKYLGEKGKPSGKGGEDLDRRGEGRGVRELTKKIKLCTEKKVGGKGRRVAPPWSPC